MSSVDNIRARVIVCGKVQGVFFRESTRRAADAAGVTGWVRNLPDGRVEAVFEGAEAAVEKMIAYVHEGPQFAQVTDVEVDREAYAGEFKEFSVLRRG